MKAARLSAWLRMTSVSRSTPTAQCTYLTAELLKTESPPKGLTKMEALWHDVRYGARMLLKQPGFTLIAVAALALSIGANTAIFSAVNTLLLSPLPVANIGRLVFGIALREGFDPFGSSFLEYAAYRDRSHSFVSSGIAAQRSFNLIGQGEPERVRGATVMADYLTTLGVKPVVGRIFSAQEDQAGGPPLALISYG